MSGGGVATAAVIVGIIAAVPAMNRDSTPDVASGDIAQLRSAVSAANRTPGNDTITLPAGSTYVLDGAPGENANATGDLDVLPNSGTLTIDGNGATLDANNLDRFFDVLGGNLELRDVSVINGNAPATERGNAIRGAAGTAITVNDGTMASDTSSAGSGAPIATTGELSVDGTDRSGTGGADAADGTSPPASAVPGQPNYTG